MSSKFVQHMQPLVHDMGCDPHQPVFCLYLKTCSQCALILILETFELILKTLKMGLLMCNEKNISYLK